MGTWDDKSSEIPCWSWKQYLKLKRYVISHWGMPHSLNCTCYICYICYCDCRWKKTAFKTGHRLRPPAVVVPDVHGGLCCQQLLGALHVAVACCPMQRSPTSAPAEWRPAPWAPAAIAELPTLEAVQDVHGGALRHQKRDDRRVVVPCCPVQRWPVIEESVHAAAVPAQVAPDAREVAVRRRAGDVGVSARGGMKQKWRCFFPLISFDLSDFSKSKSAKSATIEIRLNQLETWTYWTLKFMMFNVMELEVQLQITSRIFCLR